jgi:hypothetical protein
MPRENEGALHMPTVLPIRLTLSLAQAKFDLFFIALMIRI